MKKALMKAKILLPVFMLFVSVFFYGTAKAALLDQQFSDGNFTGIGLGVGGAGGVFYNYPTPTNFGRSDGLIGSISVDVQLNDPDGHISGCSDSDTTFKATLVDGSSTIYDSSNTFSKADLTELVPRTLFFTFSSSSTINLSSNTLSRVIIQPTSPSCGGWTANVIQVSTNSGYLSFSVFDQSDESVFFRSPNFDNGFKAIDFSNWWTCVNITSNHTFSSYDVAVTYGTSSPDSPYIDDLSGQVGYTTIPSGQADHSCFFVRKDTPLNPGNYKARASLFDQNGVLLTETSELDFTITTSSPSSTPLIVPNSVASTTGFENVDTTCPPTKWQVFGVDFGSGVCEVIRFLFIPNQSTLSQFASLKDTMATRAPFSYFYQATDALSNISVSSSTFSGLTINTGTNTPIHVSADVFSSDTINRYTTPTSRSALRTIMQVVLYLLFLTMIIAEVRHLFRGNAGGAK